MIWTWVRGREGHTKVDADTQVRVPLLIKLVSECVERLLREIGENVSPRQRCQVGFFFAIMRIL